jgi:hypothetical protein
MTGFTDHARNDAILARRDAGESLAALARAFALSRTRVQQIVRTTRRRHRNQDLGILGLNVRAWNVLANMGLVSRDDIDTLTRDILIARLADIDLVAIGAGHNCGQHTLDRLADLLQRPRVKAPAKAPRRPPRFDPPVAVPFNPNARPS